MLLMLQKDFRLCKCCVRVVIFLASSKDYCCMQGEHLRLMLANHQVHRSGRTNQKLRFGGFTSRNKYFVNGITIRARFYFSESSHRDSILRCYITTLRSYITTLRSYNTTLRYYIMTLRCCISMFN